jgi:anhydro-N-acetylmuramic acid kinase
VLVSLDEPSVESRGPAAGQRARARQEIGCNVSELPPMVVMGLMSGTSADGVDAVVARLRMSGGRLDWEVLARRSAPYPAELRRRLLLASKPGTSDVVLLTQLNAEVGRAYAELASALAEDVKGSAQVELLALSGQTVYHIPRVDAERDWRVVSTLQLGEAALVAERCGVPVMCDFRQGDMAAGGQGAPMVAFGDLLLYGLSGVSRAVHNLGGISNLTYLSADGNPDKVFAFDTGPANCLMDDAMERFAGKGFDEEGRLAAAGTVDRKLLSRWLEHPYLRLPPPKTTGREVFDLEAFIPERPGNGGSSADRPMASPDLPDLMATLCAYTAESIAAAYREFVIPHGLDEVLLAGGGALNPTLVGMLRELLPLPVRTFAELGYDARDREALAFAVMAYCGYHGQPNTLPAATGASRAVVAGKLLDHRPRG